MYRAKWLLELWEKKKGTKYSFTVQKWIKIWIQDLCGKPEQLSLLHILAYPIQWFPAFQNLSVLVDLSLPVQIIFQTKSPTMKEKIEGEIQVNRENLKSWNNNKEIKKKTNKQTNKQTVTNK